ncbi:hypothetical protein BH10BAC5_BH10BAC5_10600 [soil metagenome]
MKLVSNGKNIFRKKHFKKIILWHRKIIALNDIKIYKFFLKNRITKLVNAQS